MPHGMALKQGDPNVKKPTHRSLAKLALNSGHILKLETFFGIQITSVSFLRHKKNKSCDLHIDSRGICSGPNATIIIISLSTEEGVNGSYELDLEVGGEMKRYEIPLNHFYSLEGIKRWAKHSFETKIDKLTWRIGGNPTTSRRLYDLVKDLEESKIVRRTSARNIATKDKRQ